jgi:3-hydroxyisobutyrate dehydrogenase-like beta-hydroxyacid dehydrogenase
MALRRLGFIGIGKMGAPMVRRLLAAGYPIVACDTRVEAVDASRDAGAEEGRTPADVASRTDAVITMLPHARAVEEVAYGDEGLVPALRPGQVLIEMTSSHPRVTRRLEADLAPRGVRVLDAPVSGGVRGATDGTLCIMVGGAADLLEICRPILERLGRDIVRVGDAPGDGDTAKTINNLLSATTVWSVMEALALATRAGLAPERLMAAVNHSTGRSHTTEAKVGRYVLTRRFDSGFTVAQYLKDLEICLSVADDLGVPMPLGSLLRQMWKIAVRDGFGDLDHTALARLLERWADVEVRLGDDPA